MKIAQVSKLEVPPKNYGGTERLIFWLSIELKNLGHEVTIYAPGCENTCKKHGLKFTAWNGNQESLKEIISKDTDIVHYHEQIEESLIPNIPRVFTLHGNHRSSGKLLPNTIFISQSHANNHNADFYIYNGIPKDDYPFQIEKNGHLLYMALVSWRNKNVKTAVNLALDRNLTIDVCGGDVWQDKKASGFWRNRARKYKMVDQIRACGAVNDEEKKNYLKNSSLLFYIVNWQEPFGLAPHEALACGTPVLASTNGALKEYIVNGHNGFLVNSYAQALKVLKKYEKLSLEEKSKIAHQCRDSAFSIQDCAVSYEQAYIKVLDEGELYPVVKTKYMKYKRPKTIKIKRPLLP